MGLWVVIAVRDMGARGYDGGDIGVTGIWGGVEGGGDGEGLGWGQGVWCVVGIWRKGVVEFEKWV